MLQQVDGSLIHSQMWPDVAFVQTVDGLIKYIFTFHMIVPPQKGIKITKNIYFSMNSDLNAYVGYTREQPASMTEMWDSQKEN